MWSVIGIIALMLAAIYIYLAPERVRKVRVVHTFEWVSWSPEALKTVYDNMVRAATRPAVTEPMIDAGLAAVDYSKTPIGDSPNCITRREVRLILEAGLRHHGQ